MRARLLVLAALLAVAAVPFAAPGAQAAPKKKARAASLVRFDDCRALTGFARRWSLQTGGTTGVPFRGGVVQPAALREPGVLPQRRRTAGSPEEPPMALPSPAATTDAGAGAEAPESFSTTNVQEAGVDEPDLVKTDGKRLYVVAYGALRVFDVTGPVPKLLARMELRGVGHALLLRGERLLVIASEGDASGPVVRPMPVDAPATTIAPAPGFDPKVLLTEVDVSTAASPKVARTMELAGVVAGARMTGGTIRLIVASTPDPITADDPEGLETEIEDTAAAHWLPRTTIRSRITRRTFRRSVVPCSRVRHPRVFSGLDLLSVLTVDFDRGLFSVERDAVMAGAQDVYASTKALYVASRRYAPAAPDGVSVSGGTTEIHMFDAGAGTETTYRGSGSVPGFVLNQFALSEHEGALRVATTEDAPFAGGRVGESESGVSVLRPDGGRLVTVGRVGGLGKGERIYAVRFLGERGYVVTFRQVDPLYTLDLRDPTAPKVTGELKVAGYSAYLHPISDTLLLGVGQDATEQGRTLGPQVSLFDVGNPAAPRLVARAPLGTSGSSAAEQDHHAFLWWSPANLAVLPVEAYGADDQWFSGAIGFRVGTGGVGEVGRITHPQPAADRSAPPIGRSVAVGDRLLTLSATGVAVNRIADLAPVGFTPLG